MLEVNGTGGLADGAIKINGTTHASHFYYGFNEDTYIRSGKDNSLVVISDTSARSTHPRAALTK